MAIGLSFVITTLQTVILLHAALFKLASMLIRNPHMAFMDRVVAYGSSSWRLAANYMITFIDVGGDMGIMVRTLSHGSKGTASHLPLCSFSSTTFLLAGGRSLSGTKLINAFLTVSLLAPCVVCAVLPSVSAVSTCYCVPRFSCCYIVR